jgi:hypothetical protein
MYSTDKTRDRVKAPIIIRPSATTTPLGLASLSCTTVDIDIDDWTTIIIASPSARNNPSIHHRFL